MDTIYENESTPKKGSRAPATGRTKLTLRVRRAWKLFASFDHVEELLLAVDVHLLVDMA